MAGGGDPLHGGRLRQRQVQLRVRRAGAGGGGQGAVHPAGLREGRDGPVPAVLRHFHLQVHPVQQVHLVLLPRAHVRQHLAPVGRQDRLLAHLLQHLPRRCPPDLLRLGEAHGQQAVQSLLQRGLYAGFLFFGFGLGRRGRSHNFCTRDGRQFIRR